MKNKIISAEKLSDALQDIDDDLLDEAIRLDSAQKLKTTESRSFAVRNPLRKIVAIAASIVLVAGIISMISKPNMFQTSISQTTTAESSTTVDPNRESIRPAGSVLNFDSIGALADFLTVVKTTPSEYNAYCLSNDIGDSLPFEIAEKIADTILASEYHARLKDGVKADSFTALYTDDGVLRLAFTIGQTKYVFSHFYGVTAIADHSEEHEVGTFTLGEKTILVFRGEDHFFADEVFGNTRIYIAAFTDYAEEDIFSDFEFVPTSEAFNN